MRIALAIAPGRLRVVERGGRHHVELDVAVFSGDRRERIVSELWQRIDLDLTAAELDAARRQDIKYSLTFAPDRVPAHVKVVVYDHAADLIGSAAARVR